MSLANALDFAACFPHKKRRQGDSGNFKIVPSFLASLQLHARNRLPNHRVTFSVKKTMVGNFPACVASLASSAFFRPFCVGNKLQNHRTKVRKGQSPNIRKQKSLLYPLSAKAGFIAVSAVCRRMAEES